MLGLGLGSNEDGGWERSVVREWVSWGFDSGYDVKYDL